MPKKRPVPYGKKFVRKRPADKAPDQFARVVRPEEFRKIEAGMVYLHMPMTDDERRAKMFLVLEQILTSGL